MESHNFIKNILPTKLVEKFINKFINKFTKNFIRKLTHRCVVNLIHKANDEFIIKSLNGS